MNEEDLTKDPEQMAAWLRQDNIGHIGMMGVGLIWVQPFLTSDSLDQSAKVCVAAWAVAIPLLAALVLLNEQETFRGRPSGSKLASIGKALGQTAAFTGLVAGFWHIWWPAGVTLMVSAVVATGVHSAGYVRLEHSDHVASVADAATADPSTSDDPV